MVKFYRHTMAQITISRTNYNKVAIEEFEYPFEYFDAQVLFAIKWAEISGEPIAKTLLERTALYRRLTNAKPSGDDPSPLWQNLVDIISQADRPEQVSSTIYSTYLQQPHSRYREPSYPEDDGKHFGFFSFDHYSEKPETGEKDCIKVHFINKNRGEKSGLDPLYLTQRQADLERMFTYIRNMYPQAQEVIGGSWLYALSAYRDSFPPQFTAHMKRLVPKGFEHIPNSVPNMSFGGNSVWGQFVNRRGGVRRHAYNEFVERVDTSKSLDELIDAFPDKPYQPKVPISVFYDWIDSRTTSTMKGKHHDRSF